MSKKPVVLMILDGYGLNKTHEGNAVYEAKKPVMDRLMKECPFVEGQASGLAVGLPEGQMGNSEVGHLNRGAGRIVYQELTRITKSIKDGDFFKNEALLHAVKNAKENGSALHLFGLLSDGGVHSHITHLFGLLELAKKEGLEKVYVHCFLDGRDTPPQSGKGYVQELTDKLAELGPQGLITTLKQLADGTAKPEVQDETLVTYAEKLSKEEARIDWSLSAAQLERCIRAFNPWPMSWLEIEGQPVKVWKASVIDTTTKAAPGTILEANKQDIQVATGDGILNLLSLQPAGKKAMSAQDLLNSRREWFVPGNRLA